MKNGIRSLGLLSAVLSMFTPAWDVSAAQVSAGQVGTGVTDQQPAAQANGYPVTGRVLCGDTQRPARFAQVTLIPAQEEADGMDGRGRRVSTRTDLDGNFSATNVPPGDYYVTGMLTGYISETSQVQAALSAVQGAAQNGTQGSAPGTDPGAALAGVPLVRVGPGGASAALTLQRGGVIAGTVQWDDGSPAGGIQVIAQPAPVASATGSNATQSQRQDFGGSGNSGGFGASLAGTFTGGFTDDRGHFRLTGIPPGSYVVRANVQAPAPTGGDNRGYMQTLNIAVYAPGKMRRGDAAVVTLAGAEERVDVAITMGLAGMHNVSGVVGSTAAAVHSGTVLLTDQTDNSLRRLGTIGTDGSFLIPYVPPGNYTLSVGASSQVSGNGGRGYVPASGNSITRFQPLQESITVTDGDLTGLALTATPAATSQ